ncbi:MAG: phosphatidylinositol dimannoside acyltransferase [Frankiaceae bacterium]|jgi:KDO2-lipid IV(A) lauroyltransferase|nr:phosphatidylinositol dimannoside acyltransferase [Frankiaceae bacterium]
MSGRLTDALYGAGWAVVRGMPERLARHQFDAIADVVYARRGNGVRRLEVNLRRVLGPDVDERHLRRTTHLGVRSYLRYWREVFQLPRMKTAEAIARMDVIDDWRLREPATSGEGLVLGLPHMGNWDHAGAWLAGTGVPFTTVAERLEPASLFDRFVEFRESLGMEVIPLTGGDRPPFEVLAERLRAGGTLALLADRDLTATGLEVDFFGAPARMPAGPAALALDTGAALVPITLSYPDERRTRLRAHPRIDPPASGTRAEKIQVMTQRLADAFAAAIAADPQDWHMLQRVWVADLDPARLPAPVGGRPA